MVRSFVCMYVLYVQKASVSTYEVPRRVAGSSGRLTLGQFLLTIQHLKAFDTTELDQGLLLGFCFFFRKPCEDVLD